MTEHELVRLERHLKAVLGRHGAPGDRTSMIEIVDSSGLWPQGFATMVPMTAGIAFDRILAVAPSVACAAASEIGFRFQGIGTVFWADLETALGATIAPNQRHALGAAFEDLAERHGLCRPSDSAFSQHFSIISWPLANALMPRELAAAVGRLLARGPASGLPSRGRTPDLEAMRAWASAAEGPRLVDWLRIKDPAMRVMTALMTDNRDETLPPASFERVERCIRSQPEAFNAVRVARSRSASGRVPSRAEPVPGRLALSLEPGNLSFYIAWDPLQPTLLAEARATARAAGWRPRLWGSGSALHRDAALGPGPMRIALDAPPKALDLPYPDGDDVFGPESDVAAALRRRAVDWGACMVFEPDAGRRIAEQRVDGLDGATGTVWLAVAPEAATPEGLLELARVCGCRILEADLASARDRSALAKAGLLNDEPKLQIARHPIDAMVAPRRTVTAFRAVLAFAAKADGGWSGVVRPLRQGSREVSLPDVRGTATLDVVPMRPVSFTPALEISLLERDSAFEALVAKRLLIQVESRFPLVAVPCRASLSIDGVLIASGSDVVASLPTTIPNESRLLAPIYEDSARERLLASGRGMLKLFVGGYAIDIRLRRPSAFVDWNGRTPELVGTAEIEGLVSADAKSPHRFMAQAPIAAPARGASASGIMLAGSRIAHPLLVQTSNAFDLGDLTARFGEAAGSRRMFDGGLGVAELARARVAWARARCETLAAIGARSRVVLQFESVLAFALCGREWQRREDAGAAVPRDPHRALWRTALDRGLVALPEGATDNDETVLSEAFAKHVRRLDPEWPTPGEDPIEGAMDDALNATFAEGIEKLVHSAAFRGLDADDFDFGSPSEDWNAAARHAVDKVGRSDLAALLAPTEGARSLRLRSYSGTSLPDLAEDLSTWTRSFALARGRLTVENAVLALQIWLSPGACEDPDGAVLVAARDPFVARAVRYSALRLAPFLT